MEDHVLTITRAGTYCGPCMFLDREDAESIDWCLFFDVEIETEDRWGGEVFYHACEKCRRLIR